jgi:hypothetical protein
VRILVDEDLQGVAEDTQPKLPACKGSLYNIPFQFRAGGDTGASHTCLGKFMFFWCEPPRLIASGETGEDQVSGKRDGKRNDAVNDEQPAPTCHATNTMIGQQIVGRFARSSTYPFRLVYAAAWRYPPNMTAMLFEIYQTPVRLKTSSGLYQDPSMYVVPDATGVSSKPSKKRVP